MANYKTYRIGDVVELCTETNSDLKYGLEHVRGVSNTKEIQVTKANLLGRNLAPFHVVRKNEFIYNRRTSRNGERVGLGFNNTENTYIFTEDYVHFRIKNVEQLLPDYLYMFFKRDEFDREARYNSWGSATEMFNWQDMQAIKINVPPIEEQRRIVSEYQTVERRIQNNELLIKKLEETAQAIYHHTFVEGIDENNLPEGWRMGCLGDYCDVRRGASPRPIDKYMAPYGLRWLKISDATASGTPYIHSTKEYIKQEGLSSTVLRSKGDLIVSNSATPELPKILDADCCLHDGWLYFENLSISKEFFYLYFLYNREKMVKEANGAVFLNLKTDIVKSMKIVLPPDNILKLFSKQEKSIFDYILMLSRETSHLRTLLSLLTSKLS